MSWDRKDLTRLNKKFRKAPQVMRRQAKLSVDKGGAELSAAMRRMAPVDDGQLRDAIMHESAQGSVYTHMPAGRVFVNYKKDGRPRAPHAHFVEFGTAPHIIRSKSGKRLGPRGKFGFIVRHPGSKPQPFFYPTYRAMRTRIRRRITRAYQAAAKEIARG